MKKRFMICLVLISICCMGGCNDEEITPSNVPAQTPMSSSDQSFASGEVTQTPSVISEESADVKYSNEKTPEELITVQYPADKFDNLQKELRQERIYTFNELSKDFKFECVRFTDEYYVILMQDDGKKAFLVFFDNLQLFYVGRYSDFKSKVDYDFIEIGKTTMDEICEMDPNSYVLPFSSFTCSTHVVKEGGFVIEYDFIDSFWRVMKLDFYENSELINLGEDNLIINFIPVILAIDKQ